MPEGMLCLGRSAVQASIVAPVKSYTVHRPASNVKALDAIVLGMGVLTACSTGGNPFCDGASQDSTGSSGYSLGSGDRLQVVVFRHPDLSGEFALDGEGSWHCRWS